MTIGLFHVSIMESRQLSPTRRGMLFADAVALDAEFEVK